jgi:hypothetical protein
VTRLSTEIKMPRNYKINARLPALGVTVAAGTLFAMTIVLSRPEAVLDQSFEAGLAANSRPSAHAAPNPRQLADSPYFWLSKSEPNGALGLAQPVRLGDRITVSSQSDAHSVLEVIDIRDLDGDVTRAEAAARPRLLLVSCKILGSVGDRVVRFIVEAGDSEPEVLAAPSPRAL